MKDIEILHEIVAAAQEKLEDNNGLQPLPAAALFKAYDEVLPRHGVDPDDENHLSRLIFRVGGEKGFGSLPEKFQTVLAGMGIALEFGDHDAPSAREYASSRSSFNLGEVPLEKPPALSRPSGEFEAASKDPPETGRRDDSSEQFDWHPDAGSVIGAIQRPNMITDTIGHDDAIRRRKQLMPTEQNQGYLRPGPALSAATGTAKEELELADLEGEVPIIRSALLRLPLLAILDRWRAASKDINEQQARSAHPSESRSQNIKDAKRSQTSNSRKPSPSPVRAAIGEIHNKAESPLQTHTKPPEAGTSAVPVPSTHLRQTPPPQKTSECYIEYTAMMHRAGRAREIYLASRAFNHWAERTAARLEKEAIARRHMIRFRCFLGWSHAPNSRSPAIDQLRAATAVQKLQRAVACQEEQLRAAAVAIEKTHRVETARRTITQWLCSTRREQVRCEVADRMKVDTARTWRNLVTSHLAVADSTAKRSTKMQKQQCVNLWVNKTQQVEGKFAISKQVGLVRPAFAHLAIWWDYTEVQKRAGLYRAHNLWSKAHHVLNAWNLRARAQAFVWRTDYNSVTCALNNWSQSTRRGLLRDRAAASFRDQHSALTSYHQVEKFAEYTIKLEYYASRARLYIMAKKFLSVLDHSHAARKAARKDEIRQQLRLRYKEASSARKKRQFHTALELWRSSAQRHAYLAVESAQHVASDAFATTASVVAKWAAAAQQDDEQRAISQNYVAHDALNRWDKVSTQLSLQEFQSWDMWAQGKKRYALKSWSIASLQGSGRAHTATMVEQRHEADIRARVLQAWRRSCSGSDTPDTLNPSTTPRLRQSFSSPSTRRAFSSHRPMRNFEPGQQHPGSFITSGPPLDTPTRWTGRPVAMPTTLSKPMPAVKESDERSSTSLSLGDDFDAGHNLALGNPTSRQDVHRNLVLRPSVAASTTPQAPIPSNLRRSVLVRNPTASKSTPSSTGRPQQSARHTIARQSDVTLGNHTSYVDSAIQTAGSLSATTSQRASTLRWRSPTTPNRLSVGARVKQGRDLDSSIWTSAAKMAPEPTHFMSRQHRDARLPQDSNEEPEGDSLRRSN